MPELHFIESSKPVDVDQAIKIIAYIILRYLEKGNNAGKGMDE
jgi:hypothetical protein